MLWSVCVTATLSHRDLAVACSPEMNLDLQEEQGIRFVFPSVLSLLIKAELICLHSVYMPFVFHLRTQGLPWIVRLHFGGLRKKHSVFLPCFL